jgi:hypothetical protein
MESLKNDVWDDVLLLTKWVTTLGTKFQTTLSVTMYLTTLHDICQFVHGPQCAENQVWGGEGTL